MKPLAHSKGYVSAGYSDLIYSHENLQEGPMIIPISEKRKLTFRKRFSNLPMVTWLISFGN